MQIGEESEARGSEARSKRYVIPKGRLRHKLQVMSDGRQVEKHNSKRQQVRRRL